LQAWTCAKYRESDWCNSSPYDLIFTNIQFLNYESRRGQANKNRPKAAV